MPPDADCRKCPRLVSYRDDNRRSNPCWHNAPVLPFGETEARLLIVGLAPGRTGANRTGSVFTGDAAGRMLFETLMKAGFAASSYASDGADTVQLVDCRITNAILCAPPGNRPLPKEERNCRTHLHSTITSMPNLRVLVTLGDVARRNVLKALGFSGSALRSGHGSVAEVSGYTLIGSYHCSRLNLNTGRLKSEMFAAIFNQARQILG